MRSVMLLCLLTAACDTRDPPVPAGSPARDTVAADTVTRDRGQADAARDEGARHVDLVDPRIAPAAPGEDGWGYHRTAAADLDGDGLAERVVLMARVELIRGQPAWDDGQPWQVYIERATGERIPLYSKRLQLGTLTMRVATHADAPPTVVLIEHLPHQFSVYEVLWDSDRFITVLRFQRELDPTGDSASPILP